MIQKCNGSLRVRVELPNGVNFVTKKLNTYRVFTRVGKNIKYASAQRKFTRSANKPVGSVALVR